MRISDWSSDVCSSDLATGLERGAVEHVDERAAALDMTEELQAETASFAGAFDEPWDVGDREPDVAGLDDAEVGVAGGARVVGDLRARSRDGSAQAGPARGGETDPRHVGDGPPLEAEVALPTGGAQQGEAERLAAGGLAKHQS